MNAPEAPSSRIVVVSAEELRSLVREVVAELLEEPRKPPSLLDRRGLAQALHCGVDMVDKLRGEGCPEIRIGEVPRFELGDVLVWLKAR